MVPMRRCWSSGEDRLHVTCSVCLHRGKSRGRLMSCCQNPEMRPFGLTYEKLDSGLGCVMMRGVYGEGAGSGEWNLEMRQEGDACEHLSGD